MNDNSKLRLAFYELEKQYRPYFDYFIENQEKYREFRGGVTIDGYLNFEPELLLLGYNPAHGKYREWQYKDAHLVNQGERPFGCFERWNARKNGNWWELDKPINNVFPANIVELLYRYTELIGGNPERGTNKWPHWASNIEERIMNLNLYPFGTENGDLLRTMFKKLTLDPLASGHSSFKEEWDVRRHFVYLLHQFISSYVKPKCIVCFGTNTMSDFTYGQFKEIEEGIFISDTYTNVVGISRKGTWTSRVTMAAELVAAIVSK